MSNVDIYTILSSKPHNKHYLARYFNFILACGQANSSKTKDELGRTEKHHICPKAKDLFPEYTAFKDHPWNCVVLTARQHFIAHWMLWKAYGGSQTYAFLRSTKDKNSKTYELVKIQHSKIVSERSKGKSTYVDKEGNSYRLSKDDPIIKEKNLQNILKGKPSNSMRGRSKYYTPNGELISCKTDDPRVISGELVNFSKGRPASEYQKQRASEVMTGRKLSEYSKTMVSLAQRDNKTYRFVNTKTKEEFIGLRIEFKKEKGFTLAKLFGSTPKESYNGWSIDHSFDPKSMDEVSDNR